MTHFMLTVMATTSATMLTGVLVIDFRFMYSKNHTISQHLRNSMEPPDKRKCHSHTCSDLSLLCYFCCITLSPKHQLVFGSVIKLYETFSMHACMSVYTVYPLSPRELVGFSLLPANCLDCERDILERWLQT